MTFASGAGFIASTRRWYRRRSFKPRRLGRRPVTDTFQDGSLRREVNLPADGSQGVAQPRTPLWFDRRCQDLAHLGLGAAAMLLGPHPQDAVHVSRHVADRQDCPDAPSTPSPQRSEVGFRVSHLPLPNRSPHDPTRLDLERPEVLHRSEWNGCGSDLLCTRQRA